jgi:hypothetical protein
MDRIERERRCKIRGVISRRLGDFYADLEREFEADASLLERVMRQSGAQVTGSTPASNDASLTSN